MKTNHLLRLGAAFAVTLLPLSSLRAQAADATPAPAPHSAVSIEDRLAKMKTRLELSDDQVTKLKAVFEEQKAALDPIFQDTTLSKEQKRDKAKPIMEASRAKIDAVLTPEQKTKMDAARKSHQEKANN